jgi:plastocyanin
MRRNLNGAFTAPQPRPEPMNLSFTFIYRQRIARRIRPLTLGLAMLISSFASRAETIYVSYQDYAFDPQFIAINVGDTVVWHNYGGEHTVTSDDELFDSDITDFGQEFTYTFDEAGVYPYHCSIHGSNGSGMYGSVIVTEPGDNSPPDAPVNESPVDGSTDQAIEVTLNASDFSDPDDIDFHAASEWVIRNASTHAVVVDSGEVTDSAELTSYNPTGLTEGTTYEWQVRYKDGRDGWSDYSTPTSFTTLVVFSEQGVGLLASYNNTADFTTPLVVETNSLVDFNWGNVRPDRRITADNFAVRWEGALLPKFTETYQIQFEYRGRARVWVNNQLLIDEWDGCPFSQTRRGSVSLVAGQLVAVRVEYAADPGGALAILRWISPSQIMEVVPTSQLFPQAP